MFTKVDKVVVDRLIPFKFRTWSSRGIDGQWRWCFWDWFSLTWSTMVKHYTCWRRKKIRSHIRWCWWWWSWRWGMKGGWRRFASTGLWRIPLLNTWRSNMDFDGDIPWNFSRHFFVHPPHGTISVASEMLEPETFLSSPGGRSHERWRVIASWKDKSWSMKRRHWAWWALGCCPTGSKTYTCLWTPLDTHSRAKEQKARNEASRIGREETQLHQDGLKLPSTFHEEPAIRLISQDNPDAVEYDGTTEGQLVEIISIMHALSLSYLSRLQYVVELRIKTMAFRISVTTNIQQQIKII